MMNHDVNTGRTGLSHPNELWAGYLSPENKYTLEKLQVLDPNEKATAVAAQRAELQKTRPKFKEVQVKYKEDGEIKTKPGLAKEKDIPVHEFILGQKFITPSIVAAQRREDGYAEEAIKPDTLDEFDLTLEKFATKSGNMVGNSHQSAFTLSNGKNTKIGFSWTAYNDREVDPLTDRVEIGSLTFTSEASEEEKSRLLMPEDEVPDGLLTTTQYTLFEGDNGPYLHRHVWLADPDFVYPTVPPNPQDLHGQERTDYQFLLASVIENNSQMEATVEGGYATVGNNEASSVSSAVNQLG